MRGLVTVEMALLGFLCGWMSKWTYGRTGHQTWLDVTVIVVCAGGALWARLLPVQTTLSERD